MHTFVSQVGMSFVFFHIRLQVLATRHIHTHTSAQSFTHSRLYPLTLHLYTFVYIYIGHMTFEQILTEFPQLSC